MNIRFIIGRWSYDYFQGVDTSSIENDITHSLILNEQATIVDLLYYLNRCGLISFSQDPLQPFKEWKVYCGNQKLNYFSTIRECCIRDGDTLVICGLRKNDFIDIDDEIIEWV